MYIVTDANECLIRDGWTPPVVPVVIEVQGGVAEVSEAPAGVEVTIIDYDTQEGDDPRAETFKGPIVATKEVSI